MNKSDATQHCASNGERRANNAEYRESQIEWKPYQVRKEQSSTCIKEEELTDGLIGKEKSVSDLEEITTFVADYLKKKRKEMKKGIPLWVGTVSRFILCTIIW